MCDRHRELLDSYQQAVSRFSAALDALKVSKGTISKQEYDRLYGYVEQARTASEEAQLNLDQHVAKHGCDYLNAAAPGK